MSRQDCCQVTLKISNPIHISRGAITQTITETSHLGIWVFTVVHSLGPVNIDRRLLEFETHVDDNFLYPVALWR